MESKIKKDVVSVVFPTMNRKEDLIKCIESIKKSTHKKIEIVIADNGSTDGTQKEIKKRYPEVILLKNELNLGSPIAINNCIKKSSGEFILRLDDDEIIEEDTIEKMLRVLKSDTKIGAVSCLYFYTEEPDLLRSAGFTLNMFLGKTFIHGRDQKYHGQFSGNIKRDAVGGGSLLARREIYNEIGFYDESYFLTYEDVDWCLRLRKAGYLIVVVGSARLYHKRLGGLAQTENPFRVYLGIRGQTLFMKKNAGLRNLFFMPLLLFFISPFKLFLFVRKKQFKSANAFMKGIFDGLFNEQVFVYTQERKQVPYIR